MPARSDSAVKLLVSTNVQLNAGTRSPHVLKTLHQALTSVDAWVTFRGNRAATVFD
jgi:hypothetical protein